MENRPWGEMERHGRGASTTRRREEKGEEVVDTRRKQNVTTQNRVPSPRKVGAEGRIRAGAVCGGDEQKEPWRTGTQGDFSSGAGGRGLGDIVVTEGDKKVGGRFTGKKGHTTAIIPA